MRNVCRILTKAFVYLALFVGSFCIYFFLIASPVNYKDLIVKDYKAPDVTIGTDVFGYTSVKLNEDRDFKIMQLTDTHITYGKVNASGDANAIKAMNKLVINQTPDIIIVTGDVVYNNLLLNFTNDNLNALKVFSEIMESYKTPWTITFGNHDTDGYATDEELCDYLESDELTYCLFERGPEDINGYGNHVVTLYNSYNNLIGSLIMLDSNRHIEGLQSNGYETIAESQVIWYEEVIKKVTQNYFTQVNSYVFYHIPQKIYKDAWQLYKDGSDEVRYFYGIAGEMGEKISIPKEDNRLFEKMVELDSTKAIFCGHNHLNDFSIEYKGIRLTFGKSIDYTAYPLIANKTEQRGCTMLKLSTVISTNFTITPIKLVDIS